ncbi:hypothetical protein AtubIFM55763_010965 [Aspergillus tubingensis]|uniref:non-specific serine/threonine protein kinase n=1 Tax=Aspergillus tubingensis TaxID=5068 RepID=A0A9W6ERQ9_ASPTU|nr:hypothetical protein AtubIFM55763_010965 [Aspergillus tubingensis]GLA90193.1 hypothetical protein AtubIFM56815_005756 [Aspergillus tubingensis]GLA98517.1 hypothetical protein AtubIFM57143_006460 [Aspergillus tubingensis]GLB19016.1 hypothetical protein AtubIFM61612_008914 [Aspergillus tubingensis]
MTSTTNDTHAFQYQLIEELEMLERYRIGGYHPICVGDVLKSRYRVIHKLGHGAFSTIWLSRDEQKAAYVAVKVSTGDSSTHEAKILRMFKAMSMEVNIHLGNILIHLPTSLDKLSVQEFYEQFGKRAFEIPPDEAQLLLSDFGESFSPSDTEQRRRGQDCPSPLPVIPPEAYFEPDKPLTFPSDIWRLACAMYSIFGLRWLFDTTLTTRHDIASQQVDVIGEIPPEWWNTWEKRHEYFEEIGRPEKDRFVYPYLEQSFEKDVQAARQRDNMSSFAKEEQVVILSMLRSMLAMKPKKRATATDVLSSDWMVTWGLPAVKSARDNRKTGV